MDLYEAVVEPGSRYHWMDIEHAVVDRDQAFYLPVDLLGRSELQKRAVRPLDVVGQCLETPMIQPRLEGSSECVGSVVMGLGASDKSVQLLDERRGQWMVLPHVFGDQVQTFELCLQHREYSRR